MGNSNNGSKQVHYISPVDYQLIGKTNLIRWGELLEMKNSKTGQLTLMQEKYANNLEIYHQIVEECIKRISYTHKNLATIYGWAGDDTPDRFTNMYKVCIFFEHVSDNLKNSIKTRKSPSHPHNPRFSHAHQPTLQYFEESELINFISQLLDVFAFLQSHNITLGDITPDLCFITKDGILKIVDRTLLYNHISVFEMARKGISNVFLTPIELETLESDVSTPPEQNKTKADVFRLGMTLLECATLQKSTQIYDWSAYKINLDLLTSRLIQVKERYSSTIYNHLREMLKFQEHKRPDFETLKKAFEEELALTIKVSFF